MGLHRVPRHAEGVGDVVDAEFVVVPQDQAVALTGWEGTERVDHCRHVRGELECVLDRRLAIVQRHPVAQRHQTASIVVTGQVQDDRAEVCRGLVRVPDPVRGAGQSDEGLLHEVLGGVAVVEEQADHPDEPTSVLVEHLDDECVDVGGHAGR